MKAMLEKTVARNGRNVRVVAMNTEPEPAVCTACKHCARKAMFAAKAEARLMAAIRGERRVHPLDFIMFRAVMGAKAIRSHKW